MEIFNQFQSEIVTALLSLIILILVWVFRSKVKLVHGLSHTYVHKLDETPEDKGPLPRIQTVSHIVANEGSKTAHNIELVYNFKPDGFEVWPVREYTISTDKDKRFIVNFSYIPPKENLSINLVMINMEAPSLLNVSCEEMTGKLIALEPTKKFPKYIQITLLLMLLMGMIFTIYLFIKFIMLIASLTT